MKPIVHTHSRTGEVLIQMPDGSTHRLTADEAVALGWKVIFAAGQGSVVQHSIVAPARKLGDADLEECN